VTRRFETFLDIAAPAEAVWRAISEAGELMRWLPTQAVVEAGPGGRYELSWDGAWTWKGTITHWEPGRRLRWVDEEARPFDAAGAPLSQEESLPLALEIILEARGGRTRLTLVHSGLGHGASWDDELEGVSLGWTAELRLLRHYLERHLGRDRRQAWARGLSALPAGPVWAHLTSGRGPLVRGYSSDLAEGGACRLELSTGEPLEGTVLAARADRLLLASVPRLGDALFRLSVDPAGGRTMVHVRLSAWTLPETSWPASPRRPRPPSTAPSRRSYAVPRIPNVPTRRSRPCPRSCTPSRSVRTRRPSSPLSPHPRASTPGGPSSPRARLPWASAIASSSVRATSGPGA
jgi:uncharacterized protein YndB with AHSA1/START domain